MATRASLEGELVEEAGGKYKGVRGVMVVLWCDEASGKSGVWTLCVVGGEVCREEVCREVCGVVRRVLLSESCV